MPAKPLKNKDILVICIDRDNDLGVKAGISGPIIGRAANIDAAVTLGLKDPSESDVNAIFYALKVYSELGTDNKVEIATLVGDKNVGAESDKKILAQLEKVLRTHSFKEAVLISDGAGDERILPRLKTKIDVISTQQVIVKQSAQLESTYYMIADFIIKVLSDRKTAHLFLGVPAFALLLYALFGPSAWRLIVGVVGAYIFIQGFQLDKYILGAFNALVGIVRRREPSFFLYVLGASAFFIALFLGYKSASSATGILGQTLQFINASIFTAFVASAFVLCGRAISIGRTAIPSHVTYTILSFASAWIVFEVTKFGISPAIGYADIVYSVFISGGLIAASTLIERRLRKKK